MAAGSTYTPIATTTLGSATQTVTFSGITSSYTDLVLVASFGSAVANNDVRLTVNSDSGTNYCYIRLTGNGSSFASNRASNTTYVGNYFSVGTSTDNQTIIINVMNYSSTSTHKSFVSRVSAAGKENGAVIGSWRSLSAITSISVANAGNGSPAQFTSGSVFTLYGITAA